MQILKFAFITSLFETQDLVFFVALNRNAMGLVLKVTPKVYAKIFAFLVGAFVFIATVVSTEARADLAKCQQLMGRCEYYTCLEQEISCGPSGYFLSFAYPYCKKYKNSELFFSSNGKKFLNFVRPCLQYEMNNYLLSLDTIQSDKLFCSQLKSFAIDSHVTCYEQGNFCGLKDFEKFKVEALAFEQIFDPEVQIFAAKINQCF